MDADRVRAELDAVARLATATTNRVEEILALARRYRDTVANGGTLFFAGNGGSAAQAQHVAAEYVVRYRQDREALPAIALTADTSVLTAAGNDLDFERIFARQVEALCKPGDLLVLHSTSGNSANLVAAARVAKAKGVGVAALLGSGGGKLAGLADLCFVVDSGEASRIQELHLVAEHIIAGLLDGGGGEGIG